jgi:hypothetical protein
MRKIIVVILVSIFASPAFAQQTPETQALAGQLIEQMQQTLAWRARAIADEQKIADLQMQLEKLQKK